MLDLPTNLVLAAEEVKKDEGSAQPVSGLVLEHANRYPKIAYASRLRSTGALLSPVNKSGSDYAQFLAQRSIYSEMNRLAVTLLENGLGNPLMGAY